LHTTYNIAELSVLLLHHQVKGISGMKKVVMVAKWKEILDCKKAAPACDDWSDKDERRLMHLTSQSITMGDTALGRHQEVIKRQISDVISKMSKEERSELKHKLESMDKTKDSSEVNISVMPNFQTEISEAAQDEKPLLEQFEEDPVGDFSETMI
jgi:hypothetical protein